MKQSRDNNMIILGVTGGIGCGKSTVLNLLKEKYGAVILETDKIAHFLMEPGQLTYTAIVKAFGEDILASEDGKPKTECPIDRKVLGGIVFQDEKKLMLLNSLTHPAVKDYVRNEIRMEALKGTELVVVEAALLLEDHYDEICDEIWYICTSEENRRIRLKASRGMTDEKITEILDSQSSEQYYLDGSDRVIYNNGTLEETGAIVESAVKGLLKKKIAENK